MIPITHYSDFNVNSIRIKKPITIGKRKIYGLKTASDTDILVQTPRCIIPYSYVLFENSKFQLDILTDNQAFVSFLTDVYEHVYRKIRKKTKTDVIRDDYYVKKYDDTNYRVRLRNESVNTVSCYCNQKCNIDYNKICRDDRVICIFTLDRFIICSDFTIFYLKVCQIKKCDSSLTSILTTCMIIEDEQGPDLFEKYRKMKKVGVPDASIIQKMTLDGLSPTQVSKFFNNAPTQSSPPAPPGPPPPPPPLGIPPPPPPPVLNTRPSQPPTLQFLGDIKSGNFKLKSISTNPTKQNQPSKKLSGVDTSKYVPSLDDILNAKKKLKNI